ncbi:MAG TPA: CobD/CbiB family protein [Burkholderiales bacterium]|nr:CobD/CbiB family protein [Burkholderiales bacterium]
MSLLSLAAALLLEQWRPLADRRALYSLLARYAAWLEGLFNAGEAQQGLVAWLVAVAPVVLFAWVAYAAAGATNPIFAFLLNVAALYLTMGFRQRSHFFTDIHAALRNDDIGKAREVLAAWRQEDCADLDREAITRLALEEALISSHRYVFGVIFWFVLLPGPTGAILYRLSMFLDGRWGQGASPGLERFGQFAHAAFAAFDWLPSRFTAAAFAVVGDFESAVFCWRTQAATWPDRALGTVLSSGAGAIGVRLGMPVVVGGRPLDRPPLGLGDPADVGHMDSLVGLAWRALVMWLLLLLLVALAGAAS